MSVAPTSTTERLRPDASRVSAAFIERVPRDFARRHLIVSQGDEGECEALAISARTPSSAVFNIGVRLGRAVRTFIAEDERIATALDAAYGRSRREVASENGSIASNGEAQLDLARLLEAADRDLLATEGKAPVVRLVDALLFEALSRGASDVHVQPVEDGAIVRYRLDGVLHAVREVPRHIALAVVNRIKVMARCDVAEQRVPQDGRASVTIGSSNGGASEGGRPVDLRISILPTSYGERAVLRLLDRTRQLAEFDGLGMPAALAERFLRHARSAHGVILVTGPTGSGKTTTLYATLRKLLDRGGEARDRDAGGLNILTIEDPIEYDLSESVESRQSKCARGSSMSQSQVNLKKGVTFANGLRHLLRQDPDVIMVGEIRDAETARIAIQASLTGHLVFSTLHTNDACSAVTRLIDLGVEPYLVAASLSAVLAQRLVRLIHTTCDGAGCEVCLHTGFRGRTGIFELLSVDENVRRLISHGGTLAEIRAAAAENGMSKLVDDAQRLLDARLTKREEVARVVEGAA